MLPSKPGARPPNRLNPMVLIAVLYGEGCLQPSKMTGPWNWLMMHSEFIGLKQNIDMKANSQLRPSLFSVAVPQ